jgi:hypothetical protein
MKTGAAVLGIIGGVIALIIGAVSFFIGDLGATLGIEGSVPRQVLSIAVPVVALIGGGIAGKNGVAGGVLLIGAAVGIVLVLKFGFITLITAVPIGLGGILAVAGAIGSAGREEEKP